jgi:hypothetical protein
VKEWMIQKKRHLTTAPYYRFRDKVMLITETATRILFYSALIALLCFRFNWILIVAVFGIRLLTQIIVYVLTQKRLNESGILPYILFFDIFSPLLNGILFLSNTGNKSGKNRWR